MVVILAGDIPSPNSVFGGPSALLSAPNQGHRGQQLPRPSGQQDKKPPP